MHTIKYKGLVAKQDNKTLRVEIYKGDHPVASYQCLKRLSGKELRGMVNCYLFEKAAEVE